MKPFAIAFSFMLLAGVSVSGATPTSDTTQQVPPGLQASEWASIRAAYEANRHAAFAVDGGYQARNPGQQWTTRFDNRGFETNPDYGDWTWGLDLVSWGFAGNESIADRVPTMRADGQRVTYDRGEGLFEWWVNDQRGLEHGYTVHERPAGGDGNRPLTITLAVRGELEPTIDGDGRSARFGSADGSVVVHYAGLTVFDADGRSLPARFVLTDGGIAFSIHERSARYPLTIDPIAQQAYLKASNPNTFDYFGWSVAVSGDTVAVGASREASAAAGVNGDQSDNSFDDAGAVYVFVRSGGGWSQQAYVKASNPGQSDEFGRSVALSGDTLVVGAPLEDSTATGVNGDPSDDSFTNSGAAYVFTRSGSSWSQQAYLKASNTGEGDRFGIDVAVSGDTVVIGAHQEESAATGVNGNQGDVFLFAGAAYVFVRNGSTWSQQAYLKASNTGPDDRFGFSVDVEGDTVVVGAPGEKSAAVGVNGIQSDNSASDAGAAYVFIRNGSTWSQQAYVKASNTGAGDQFGYSVAISGETIVVGAFYEASAASGVNGNPADDSAPGAGAAYVFTRNGSTWFQQAYVKASNPGADDGFGIAVALSGDKVLVGAWGEGSSATGVNGNGLDNSALGSGAAYLFVRSGSNWSQLAYLKASNTGANDYFGKSVALSEETIVVGASDEASSASGVNGNQGSNSAPGAGAAYVFDLAAWPDLGFGLAGVDGVPKLVGSGTLEIGSSGTLILTSAAPTASAVLLLSLASTPVPAYCGTIVPIPAAFMLSFVTDGSGRVPLSWPSWPAGLSGQSLYFQWLISDAAAPCTVSFSNAVRGDVP